MTIDILQSICKQLPGVVEDIKWENHLCFNVGGKMFLITSPDSFPITASFKTDDETFDLLTSREGFIPAPYLARNKWVHVDDLSRMSKKQWQEIVQLSYRLVAAKLTVKLRRELGII